MWNIRPILHTSPHWGIRINPETNPPGRPKELPEGCPEWAKGLEQEDWCHRGVSIWEDTPTGHQLKTLSASEVLRVLELTKTNETWPVQGITFRTRAVSIRLEEQPPKKKVSRRKKKAGAGADPVGSDGIPGARPETAETTEARAAREPDAPMQISDGNGVPEAVKMGPTPAESEAQPAYEPVLFQVSAETSAGLTAFLEPHLTLLKEIAEAEEKEANEIMADVVDRLLSISVRHQIVGLDLSGQAYNWERDADAFKLTCEAPPNRGSVLTRNKLFWQGCVEQPDEFRKWSGNFRKAVDAVAWVEQELQSLAAQATETAAQPEPAPPPIPTRAELGRYWLDPALLEPKRLTYRVCLLLEAAPVSFQTMEMSFGKPYAYDKKYTRPEKLAQKLDLDLDRLTIEWPAEVEASLYVVSSRVMYFDPSVAAAQAQAVWDRSQILSYYRQGTIKRALYGYEENETGYQVYLGVCEDPDNPWNRSESRADHMTRMALEESLAYALDVDGYRALRQWARDIFSDDTILDLLHWRRVRSRAIPAEVRAESQRWLNSRGPVESAGRAVLDRASKARRR